MITTVQEAIAVAEEIADTIDELNEETFNKAAEFFSDIRRKAVDVGETVASRNKLSPKQASALTNWRNAVRRWVHDD